MYDLSAALSAALFPMAAVFLYRFVEYELRSKDGLSDAARKFGWCLFFFAAGVFCSCLVYFSWDFDLIYESTRLKLSAIPKGFFVASLAYGIYGLEMKGRQVACLVACCLFLGVLVTRILF